MWFRKIQIFIPKRFVGQNDGILAPKLHIWHKLHHCWCGDAPEGIALPPISHTYGELWVQCSRWHTTFLYFSYFETERRRIAGQTLNLMAAVFGCFKMKSVLCCAVAQCPFNWGVGSAFHLMKIHISSLTFEWIMGWLGSSVTQFEGRLWVHSKTFPEHVFGWRTKANRWLLVH